jgi:hypothetical protein
MKINPFQQFDLARDPYWTDVTFDAGNDKLFEGVIENLSAEFDRAVATSHLLRFLGVYADTARQLLAKAEGVEPLRFILISALGRLVSTHDFLCRRTRSTLNENLPSLRGWTIDPQMVKAAREQAARMALNGVYLEDVDLSAMPEFKRWLMDTVRPVISEYVGSPAIMPWAQIRQADASIHGNEWQSYYAQHAYGYFHYDELAYSLPTVVYLEDVDEGCGPFSYVEGGDKLPQNHVLRALHQAVGHDLNNNPVEPEARKFIGALPAALRGGDLLGTLAGPLPFKERDVIVATGKAGQVSLFEGFVLPHAGGHPKTKSRRAMFIAFRYPFKKYADIKANLAQKYMEFALSGYGK